ncbi:restriction endonuclease subunit S [Vibrio hepatarius]|uniref:restriction endonuclease subunit S n=1 Tax=Vibrio hepatarius TaxID=171383 RepID=UPI001C0A409B|nr:restriction endonuclease subunit S [Vibrio hepatarius]MBU2899150.1 restriction endonuclease subunit S [Vibrio hepatarius]
MSELEKDLEQITHDMADEPEVPLPSLEEQQSVVAELKKLEEAGELTPEILKKYFGRFYSRGGNSVH